MPTNIPYVLKRKIQQLLDDVVDLQNTPPGSGDMLRSIYDPDQDGKIANTQLAAGTDIGDVITKKHSNSLDHDGSSQDSAIASKPTLLQVKADTDIASAISLKHSNTLDHSNSLDHTQGTDQGLDGGGANAVTAVQAKAAYTHSQVAHAPSNAQANADITKAEIEAKLTGEIASHTHAGGSGDGEVTVVATQDTANNTVNLASAAGLMFSALANSTYIIEVFLIWAASATTVGIKVSATATNSPTIMSGHFICDAANGTPDGSSFNANSVVVTTSASPFTANNMGQMAGVLKTAGNNSVWQLQFAAETTGTITIKAGSTLRYRKVA